MKLFKYEGFKIEVSPEALQLKPFKLIYNKDKSKNKEQAFLELSFVYFFADPRSDYQYITDEEDRIEAIKKGLGLDKKWKLSKETLEAIDFYKSFKSTASLLLEDTRVAVDKLRALLRQIDLTALDNNGKPVYTLNTITATIKQVPILVKELDEAEKAVTTEFLENTKIKGDKEKTLFEDGF